jgi:thioredoxin-like negative regulator of GroEL
MMDASGALQNLVLGAAQQIGQAVDLENERLDEQIKRLESMGEDDLERLRERRLEQMKRKAAQVHEYRQKGHGSYRQIQDTKQFFSECKESERVVVHFFRGTTWRCEVFDKHFEKLAQTHMETKFIKIDGEKNPFLAERLHIMMLPSVVLVKGGKTEHTLIGFDEMGGEDDFPTSTLEYVLSQYGMLEYEGAAPESPRTLAQKAAERKAAAPSAIRQRFDSDSEDGWSD